MLDRTLPTTWQLRGADIPALAPVVSRARAIVVGDVEYLCAAIVVDVAGSDAPWAPTETSDLYEGLGYLLGRTVEVLDRYDPTRGRAGTARHDPWTDGFKSWLHSELRNDLIDHWRSWFGRNGQKRLPSLQSLHNFNEDGDAREGAGDGHDGRSARERRLRGASNPDSGDSGHVGLDALRRRFLEGGDRALLREVEGLGLGPDPGAGDRAAGADREPLKVAA